ncbi:Ubiquitin ligase-binding protein BUL2 [Candida viswanathii]|uniref:Ubiquitin ligase-binding protein BUL2 n=1 Tax=Candida viswanathii TaxID=5486 RepID=A0A367YBW7_9ASCO|nr:Ubiquitin ligase-binding protein BUL2 [Candida viswanathii]
MCSAGYRSTEETISAILPSYLMYTSTVGLNLDTAVQIQNPDREPPRYTRNWTGNNLDFGHLVSPQSSLSQFASPSSEYATASPGIASPGSYENLYESNDAHHTQDTLLDNIHRLPRIAHSENRIRDGLKLEIHFTKDIGEINKKPEFVDPSSYEYKRGDTINGYFLIKNTTSQPIQYEMFVVQFEGIFMVTDPKNHDNKVPVRLHKFLDIFEFFASWTEANINRLPSDSYDAHACPKMFDPLDGCYTTLSNKRQLEPNLTYKRFFTFKIPNSLLDSECNAHGLSRHIALPPSIGKANDRNINSPFELSESFDDFALPNASNYYGISARFIGRKNKLEERFGAIDIPTTTKELKSANCDQFVVFQELTSCIRLVSYSYTPTDDERSMKMIENRIILNNLILRIKQKIDNGIELVQSIEGLEYDINIDMTKYFTDSELELQKLRQLYKAQTNRSLKTDPNYETVIPVIKKHLTGGYKHLGAFKVTTPKTTYCMAYIPPEKYRHFPINNLVKTWHLEVPVNISYLCTNSTSSSHYAPHNLIKSITAEFVTLTIKSPKYPIPLEFNHDLIYDDPHNTPTDDPLKHNFIKPFRSYSLELYELLGVLGKQNFRVEKQLVEDIKSIVQLLYKTTDLHVCNIKINGESFNKHTIRWSETDAGLMGASIVVGLNLESLSVKHLLSLPESLKAYNRFNFVPDFQTCYMSRLYHIRLNFILVNGDVAHIRVPANIQKL